MTHADTPYLSETQIKGLMANLNPARIAQRTQSGSKLSYLEAWDVRAALIRVFGFGGFSIETLRSDLVEIERDVPKANGNGTTAFRVTAMATVQLSIHQLGATYSETAVSSQSGAVLGDVADFAVKTAVSDAMKRCAMNLGTQFGLSLYNHGSHVDIVGVILEPSQAALLEAARRPGRKEAADPTPQHALEGIGAADPEQPAQDDSEPEVTQTYQERADAAQTAAEALTVWREAKKNHEPQAVLDYITARGEVLRAQERPAGEGAEDAARAALEKGFGQPIREIAAERADAVGVGPLEGMQ